MNRNFFVWFITFCFSAFGFWYFGGRLLFVPCCLGALALVSAVAMAAEAREG